MIKGLAQENEPGHGTRQHHQYDSMTYTPISPAAFAPGGVKAADSLYTFPERGAAYRRYMQRAAAHPMCVGAHYFTLNDQAYLGRFDGENYQIGIVDVAQRPYGEFESAVIETHREIYDVAEGKTPVDAREAREIPAIFF